MSESAARAKGIVEVDAASPVSSRILHGGSPSSPSARPDLDVEFKKDLDAAFSAMDVNGDGVVDQHEWLQASGQSPPSPTSEQALLDRGLGRYADSVLGGGIKLPEVGLLGPPKDDGKGRLRRVEEELQEARFNNAVLQAELQRANRSEQRMQFEVQRMANELSQMRDEMDAAKEASALEVQRMKHELTSERESRGREMGRAEVEHGSLLDRLASMKEQNQLKTVEAHTVQGQLGEEMGQVSRALTDTKDALKQSCTNFLGERLRRIFEVMAKDRLASVFAEWAIWAVRSDAVKDKAVLNLAIKDLENQLAGGNKSGGMEIMKQVMKRRSVSAMTKCISRMREFLAVGKVERELAEAKATISRMQTRS